MAILVACGDGDGGAVGRGDLEARLADRLAASEGEAACIADYVVDDYDDTAVRTIYDEGVTALPQALWDPYFYAVIGCLDHDGRR
jgi:hypothetical protein